MLSRSPPVLPGSGGDMVYVYVFPYGMDMGMLYGLLHGYALIGRYGVSMRMGQALDACHSTVRGVCAGSACKSHDSCYNSCCLP